MVLNAEFTNRFNGRVRIQSLSRDIINPLGNRQQELWFVEENN